MSTSVVPIILQARMSSRRLPGKMLADLAGRPLIGHCIARLLRSGVGPVILATSTVPADDVLADTARSLGVQVYRGPEDDVLQRFCQVADYLDTRFFIRATGDNPAVDIDAPARVMVAIESTSADHAVETDLPYGAAVEAVRTSALYQALSQARDAYDREHVTAYLYRNPTRFLAVTIPAPQILRRPDVRLTVDTQDDLDFMRRVLERAAPAGDLASLSAIIESADDVARGGKVA